MQQIRQSHPGAPAGQLLPSAHRCIEPDETVARVEPFLARFGITRIANITGLDRIGIPVTAVMRPNARSLAVAQGKGTTLHAAIASGTMEAIEIWHAENIEKPLRLTRYADLARQARVADPDTLARPASSQYHAQLPLPWIEGRDIVSGESCWVPYEMVHTDYTWPALDSHGCFACSSNGLASGNTLDEAIVHGLCELIERDATTLWHQRSARQRTARRIDPETIDDPVCQCLLDRISAANLELALWDTASDLAVPSFYGLLHGAQHEHVGEGAGCHPCKAVALSRTITEAAQTRLTYISGARDDMLAAEFELAGTAAKQAMIARLTRDPSMPCDYRQLADLATDCIAQDRDTILRQLQSCGLTQAIAVDLSRHEFPVSVVRMIVPGLEAPHDDAGYRPGPRARAVKADSR